MARDCICYLDTHTLAKNPSVFKHRLHDRAGRAPVRKAARRGRTAGKKGPDCVPDHNDVAPPGPPLEVTPVSGELQGLQGLAVVAFPGRPATASISDLLVPQAQSRRIGQPRSNLQDPGPLRIVEVDVARATSGRGPTKDMSPRSTFQSSGSSSSLVRRRKRPTGVTRASPRAVTCGPPIRRAHRAELDERERPPSRPTRVWRKKTGDPEVPRWTASAHNPMTGAAATSPASASAASTGRGRPAPRRGPARRQAPPVVLADGADVSRRRPRSPRRACPERSAG